MDYSKEYGKLHENVKYFPGYSVCAYVPQIKALVETYKPTSMLDYGCGKGYQYLMRRVHEQWGGPLPYCYDIGVRHLDKRPTRKFDSVICTDVLEHIETDDVDSVLRDIFSFVDISEDFKRFVFLAICCVPAKKKTLADGRNVHLTVKPESWWKKAVERAGVPKGVTVAYVFDHEG